jgi:anti-sigma B factor antagonist
MQVTHRIVDEHVIVSVNGDLDGRTAPVAQQQIVPLIPDGGRIVLDMSSVPYMSSAGLRMMLLLYRQATAKDARIALAGLSEEIRDTMDATGFLDFFVVSDDVDSAVERLGDAQ